MTDYAITSFSPKGYKLYGKQFLEGFLATWDLPILVHYEGTPPDLASKHPDRLICLDLEDDIDRAKFIQEHSRTYQDHPWDYRTQPFRFCHKVFALTGWRPEDCERLFWIDADVICKQKPDMAALMPAGKVLTYLGRDSGPIRHSECGFVGYDTRDERIVRMLMDMRDVFTSGNLFALPHTEWHDSAIFDLCRKRSGLTEADWLNLNKVGEGIHPWKTSILQQWMEHHKGPGRKKAAYGSHLP